MEKKIYILVTAIVLGLFIVIQSRSYKVADNLLARDMASNIFQEIKILKVTNNNLDTEIDNLQENLNQLTDQNSALSSIEKEIEKYEKLAGDSPIVGPGVTVTVNGELTKPWLIDMTNEFFNSGAQAVSINGIRLTNATMGFDTLPQGQVLLNGSILSSPYVFNVIGEPVTLIGIFELPGGIFDRVQGSFPKAAIQTERKEIIQIK